MKLPAPAVLWSSASGYPYIHYNGVTDISRKSAYNSAMAANELNRDDHEFSHNGHDYWIYTFMTRQGLLRYRVWRKVHEGDAQAGEARADLIERLKKQLDMGSAPQKAK
jgi:hypothetical protein